MASTQQVESTNPLDVRGQNAKLEQPSNDTGVHWAKAVRGEIDKQIKIRQNKKKTVKFPTDEKKEYTQEEFERFLDYECNYKKHKGKKWGAVLHADPQYFTWVLTKAMNVRLKTWKVFSMILSEEERAVAFKRCSEEKVHKNFPKQKRPRSEEEADEQEEAVVVHPRMALPTPSKICRTY